jgi:hypothetical protein
MNTAIISMSAAAFVAVMGTWGVYLASIPRGKVPVRPLGSVIMQFLGAGLAGLAIVWNYQGPETSGAAVIVPAALALMMALTFLWLLTQRKTPIGDLRVKVGDSILSFKSTTSDGVGFHSDELMGKRTLLKIFRGSW